MKPLARSSAALLALGLAGAAQAECISINGPGPYGQDFNTLASSGSSSALPGGWAIRETGRSSAANGEYSAGNGSGFAGDTYSFGTSGERALGLLRSGTLQPMFGACFTNNTGATINALDIAYTGEEWRLGTLNRGVDRLDFQYSLDATGLADGAWTDVDSLDFVTPNLAGTSAGARDGNDPAYRTAISGALANLAIPVGGTLRIRWNDADASGADDGLAVDDFSLVLAGGPPRLQVSDASADEGDAGTTPLFFRFTLDKPAGAEGVAVSYATHDITATEGSDYAAAGATVVIPAGETSGTVSVDMLGDTSAENDETFSLDILSATGTEIDDGQGIGTILTDDFVITPIHDIQGNAATSPLANQFVATTGIVTGRKTNGFFLQASDADADADPLTSEAVFVYTGGMPPAAAVVGNRVRVRGKVIEYIPSDDPKQLPLTEITGSPTVTQLSTGHALPVPVTLTADMTRPDGGFGQLEFLEGMRVTASLTTTAPTEGNATPYLATGSIGGILRAVVTGVARPFREPGIQAPDTAPGGGSIPPIPQWDANPEILTIDATGLASGAGLATGPYLLNLPSGSVIEGITGPLDYGFRRYTVMRDPMVPVNVSPGPGPRAARTPGEREFTVASYNLERFYDTVDDAGIDDDIATATAFQTRLQKASLGIRDYLRAPDVLVAIEIDNLPTLQALATRINADAVAEGQPDPQYVAYLEEGNDIGGIDIGLLIKTAEVGAGIPRVEVLSVTQVGKDTLWTQPDGKPDLLNDRPPLALDAIVHYADGRAFPITVIGVHQRSLRSSEDDTPAGDRVRKKRQAQAEFFAHYLQQRQAESPHTRIVTLGDFNAFAFNDGLADTMGVVSGTPTPDEQTVVPGDGIDLIDPDLVNLGELAPPSERYSFVYEANAQTLDHVLVNEELIVTTRAASIDHARINADFTETNRSDVTTPIRTADHDPVIAYFDPRAVADLAITASADNAAVPVDGTLAFTAAVHNNGPEAAESVGVGFAIDAALPTMAVAAPAGWNCDAAQVDSGRTSVACHASTLAKDADAQFAITAAATPDTAHATVSLAAAVDALSLDRVPGNDQASAALEVVARADLSVRIAGPEKKLHTADLAAFAIDLRNAGPYTAKQATMTLRGDAPAGNVAIAAPAGWTCTVAPIDAGSFEAQCDATSLLAVDANQHFDLQVKVPWRPNATQHLTLSATADSDSIETAPADNTAVYRNRIVGIGGR